MHFIIFVGQIHIYPIVGTCLRHVGHACTNVQKSRLLHMPKACPYKLEKALSRRKVALQTPIFRLYLQYMFTGCSVPISIKGGEAVQALWGRAVLFLAESDIFS